VSGGEATAQPAPMRPWAAAALVLVATCVAYVNTLTGGWVWDDVSSVLLHEHVQDPAQFFQLFREDQHAFGRGQGNFYRPLVSVSFMVDYLLSGSPPVTPATATEAIPPLIFHISNMLWHAAAAILLLALMVRMGAPPLVWMTVPLVYAVHPLHTEAVAYISGRADMMAAALMFAGLCLVATGATGVKRWALIGLSFVFGILALLSKESALIYPILVAIVIAAIPVQRDERGETISPTWERWLPVLGAIVIVIGYGMLRSTVLRFADATDTEASPIGVRVVEMLQALDYYVRMLVWPTGLHMERTLATATTVSTLRGLLALTVIVAGLAHAVRTGHRRIAAGLAWFIVTWLPISGIFPLNAPLAEHWMYVPMAGLFWAIAEAVAVLARVPLLRPAYIAAVAVALVVFTALTAQRNLDWASNERLFASTLTYNPQSLRVQYNLAVTYDELAGNLPGARRHYEQALALLGPIDLPEDASARVKLSPQQADILISLARLQFRLGDYQGALRRYQTIANADQGSLPRGVYPEALLGVGESALALGDISYASRILSRAAQAVPALGPDIKATFDGRPFENRP